MIGGLKKMSGTKSQKVIDAWKKPHNDVLYDCTAG